MSAAAIEVGSVAHRELLAQFFMDSYVDYVPEQVQWPKLDEESKTRLASLPFWQEAVSTEHVTLQHRGVGCGAKPIRACARPLNCGASRKVGMPGCCRR